MAKFSFFKRSTTEISGEVTLPSNLLKTLSLINEDKEISQIARESGLSAEEFKQNLAKLYKLGLIVPVQKTIQKYSSSFVMEIIKELTFFVGPIAGMIVSDTLTDLNIQDQRIPVNILDKVILLISEEIPDEGQQVEFQTKIKGLASGAS